MFLDKVEGGRYLNENEFLEKALHWDDVHRIDPDADEVSVYDNLWVEDSRGHRHKIKDSRKNIQKLLETGP